MGSDGGRLTWRDPALAGGLAVLVVVSALTAPPSRTGLDPAGYALLVIGALSLVARRRSPVAVLAVASACLLAYEIMGYPGVSPAIPVFLGLYGVVRAGRRWVACTVIVSILVAGVTGQVIVGGTGPELFQRWFLLIGWMVAAAVIGANVDQAEQRALDAERTSAATAERRADEERLRIARELHDSLTHCISIIKVQAGVAVHLNRKRDQPVPEALLAIEQAAGEAMRELRVTLEVLRTEHPGLDRLEALVDGARRAGTPVTIEVSGSPPAVPADVDRAAYRIVQEALTNIARHAGAASASVRVDYDHTHLTVRVDNDGPGAPGASATPGMGLAGMRERVAALGGTLQAGPRDGGGFRVHASLPLAAGGSPS